MVSSATICDLLPQTQCGQCGYPGCQPYASAIAEGALLNLCPPGGLKTLSQLAALTNHSVTQNEIDELQARLKPTLVARIREAECIGCTHCIQACPVDAIIGAAKKLHVILQQDCTGCELCLAPCPVDCIELIPVDHLAYQPARAKAHYDAKLERGGFKRQGIVKPSVPRALSIDAKQQLLRDALARAKIKKRLHQDSAL